MRKCSPNCSGLSSRPLKHLPISESRRGKSGESLVSTSCVLIYLCRQLDREVQTALAKRSLMEQRVASLLAWGSMPLTPSRPASPSRSGSGLAVSRTVQAEGDLLDSNAVCAQSSLRSASSTSGSPSMLSPTVQIPLGQRTPALQSLISGSPWVGLTTDALASIDMVTQGETGWYNCRDPSTLEQQTRWIMQQSARMEVLGSERVCAHAYS